MTGMKLSGNVEMEIMAEELQLNLRPLPPRAEAENLVEEARRRFYAVKETAGSYIEVQNAELNLFGAENTLGYVLQSEQGRKIELIDDELPSEVQVVCIGDACIVCLPGETFVEFGLSIQAGSPFKNTFVIELANGCLPDYICTREAYAEGGYEAGASRLDAHAGERMVKQALNLLEKICQQRLNP